MLSWQEKNKRFSFIKLTDNSIHSAISIEIIQQLHDKTITTDIIQYCDVYYLPIVDKF